MTKPTVDWRNPGPAPTSGPLIDTFGRVGGDLRISVIDKCNLRCTYCMPAEGLPWLEKEELLTVDEIDRLARLFHSLGVRDFKITGGEPTVRRELPEIVARVCALEGVDVSITTNGLLLDRLARPLREAGLRRITVSCDSLLRHRYAEMTRRDAFDKVTAGLEAAREAGFDPIKINCVVIRGTNDDEAVDFARLAREGGYDVRFIEYMPLDAERTWEREKVVPAAETLAAVSSAYDLVPVTQDAPQPATSYRFADGTPGVLGFIPSVTKPFCDSCNRMRTTAEGAFRVCLFALEETDLRTALRSGADDAELERLVREALWRKWPGHKINHPDFVRPDRSMSMIGG
ncbi:GTP 3',8-cyclase MoaA [Kitasatospora sp. SUK 42]|uniref:GTP 3',8-cyclase MoaA n=1 Tax=Kitasatospora sp. SUK 42 TaxID=1588882 RepID=UPI0018CAE250|nr:GTP 3',8-cyclase MoaA [Kitasatospora sp. SUK 42]MBV2154892.1 GTP 3',8-cyclase MoaA [Kitasatospora sp. SUK 42]